MERKIGEIFEYNGEWYQCIEGIGCDVCAFNERKCYTVVDNGDPIGECCTDRRKDNKDVIFKKLEKVGKPFKSSDFDDRIVMLQSYKMLTIPYISGVICYIHYDTNIIDIEIKQNKQDMGDNDDIRPYDELFSPGTVSNTKYLAKENMEENKLDLKPFDIQKAREGKPVCTKNGKKARIICFDAKGILPIIALVESGDEEKTVRYSNSGGRFRFDGMPDEEDLMMLPEKHEGWMNVYREESNNNGRLIEQTIYKTREDAFDKAYPEGYITTTKINWEE